MIKNLIISITLILTFLTQNSFSASNKIIIEGNNRVSDETIKVYGNINLDKNINEPEINKILKKLYETNFFEDVKVFLDGNILKLMLKSTK